MLPVVALAFVHFHFLVVTLLLLYVATLIYALLFLYPNRLSVVFYYASWFVLSFCGFVFVSFWGVAPGPEARFGKGRGTIIFELLAQTL